jgi:hypothetical protein
VPADWGVSLRFTQHSAAPCSIASVTMVQPRHEAGHEEGGGLEGLHRQQSTPPRSEPIRLPVHPPFASNASTPQAPRLRGRDPRSKCLLVLAIGCWSKQETDVLGVLSATLPLQG